MPEFLKTRKYLLSILIILPLLLFPSLAQADVTNVTLSVDESNLPVGETFHFHATCTISNPQQNELIYWYWYYNYRGGEPDYDDYTITYYDDCDDDKTHSYSVSETYPVRVKVIQGRTYDWDDKTCQVTVYEIYKYWHDAPDSEKQKVVDETTPVGARSKWNAYTEGHNIMESTERSSDAAIAKGTTIPNTTLLDKILDVMAEKESGVAGGVSPTLIADPSEPTVEKGYGIMQISDDVMHDRGYTYQVYIASQIANLTTIAEFDNYLDTLKTDERSGAQKSFEIAIKHMEWLDDNYVDTALHGHYQLGDNKASAQILAAGWNGGHGAINAGFDKEGNWDMNLLREYNEDVYNYAKDIADNAYP